MLWASAGNSVDNTGEFPASTQHLLTQSGLCCSSSQPTSRRCTESWEETQPGQLIPTDPRDVSDHIASCLACKVRKRRKKGGCLEWWHLSSQGSVTLLPRAWLSACLPMGNGERIPCSALLEHMAFAFPTELSPSQPTVFSFLLCWFSPPSHRGGVREWLCGPYLPAGVKPWHKGTQTIHMFLNPYALEHPWNIVKRNKLLRSRCHTNFSKGQIRTYETNVLNNKAKALPVLASCRRFLWRFSCWSTRSARWQDTRAQRSPARTWLAPPPQSQPCPQPQSWTHAYLEHKHGKNHSQLKSVNCCSNWKVLLFH